MPGFLLRRLAMTIPVILGVATLVFSLIHLVPGDPAQSMLGESAAQGDVAELRARLGLDRPLLTQYVDYMTGALHGDLGKSFRYGTPVTQEIGARLGKTAELAFAAMLVAILIAVPLGTLAAVFKGRAIDQAAMTASLIGVSLPNFWLGPVLAMIFAVGLGWLPVSGAGTPAHLVLPAITLGAALAAVLARLTRASVIEELQELYVVAARARGLSRWRAIVRHALRNSLVPVVTVIGLQFGAVLTGTIITETIFAWPGLGRLLIQAISFRDYPLVQACILFIAVTYVAMNLLVDLAYGPARSEDSHQMTPRMSATFRVGVIFVAFIILLALVGPWLVPYDPSAQLLPLRLQGPTFAHPLGLDELGRDILARLVVGARISLLVGLAVVSVSASAGLLIGVIAGYAGGWTDTLVGRVMDVLLAFPGILLSIALVAVLGPSLSHVVLALVVGGWVGYARLARGQALKLRELEFVQAARALGAPTWRVLRDHVIPGTLPALIVQATLGMAGAIIAEASLSFLGLGVQPPTPSWGTMLDAGRGHLLDAPHLTLVPGLAIAMLVLGLNFVGDGLRDRLSPKG